MFMKTLIVAAVIHVGLGGSVALGQADLVDRTDRNAALEYWPVMHRISLTIEKETFDRAMKVAEKLYEYDATGRLQPQPTPSELAAQSTLDLWLDEIQPRLDELAVASKAEHCDFGLRWQDGYDMEVAHFQVMRWACRLLLLDARRHSEADRPEQTAERLAALVRISEHLTRSTQTLAHLFATGMFNWASSETRWLMQSGADVDSLEVLRSSLARFKDTDPFNAIATLKRERAQAALHPAWLRNGGLEKLIQLSDVHENTGEIEAFV